MKTRIHQKGKYCAGPNCDCRTTCQNTNTKGPAILAPGCMGSAATCRVAIDYGAETQALDLCPVCGREITRDAVRHGYGVKVTPWK